MTIADQLTCLPVNAGPARLEAFDNWMQGRTLYGGASALIAYSAAASLADDLPPLRSGQVTFVGPPTPDIAIHADIVRRGRSVAQIRADLICDDKPVLSSLWLFGEGREANASYPPDEAPGGIGQPGEAETVMSQNGPSFIRHNFELRRAQDTSGPGAPVVRRWARLKGDSGLTPVEELVLMGDVLPPGSMRQMQRQGPISSINWHLNMLGSDIATTDGWWLAETRGEWAGEGYSSERLALWNRDGRQVISGLQSVAIFG